MYRTLATLKNPYQQWRGGTIEKPPLPDSIQMKDDTIVRLRDMQYDPGEQKVGRESFKEDFVLRLTIAVENLLIIILLLVLLFLLVRQEEDHQSGSDRSPQPVIAPASQTR